MKNKLRVISVLVGVAVIAPAFAQAPAKPVIGTANAKVLVQRGKDFVPAKANMPLMPTDRIVVLDGGNVEVSCDGDTIASFSATGVFPVPVCPAKMATAPAPGAAPAAAPATTAPTPPPAPTPVAKSGGSWGTVAAVAGGLVGIAAAAGSTSGSKSNPPVSP